MFSAIKNRWKKIRANDAQNAATEALARYEQLADDERYQFVSAFHDTRTDLEMRYGELARWRTKDKARIAKRLMKSVGLGFRTLPYGANGIELLSLYLELQTLTDERAQRLVLSIADWYGRAVDRDLNRQ